MILQVNGLIGKIVRIGIVLLVVGIIVLFVGISFISALHVSASQLMAEYASNSTYEGLLSFTAFGGVWFAVGLALTIWGAKIKPKEKTLISREEEA